MRETGVKLTPSTTIHNFGAFLANSVLFCFSFGSAFAGHLLILLCVSPSGWHNVGTPYQCVYVEAARFISTHLNSSYFCQLPAILIFLICILVVAFLHTYSSKCCYFHSQLCLFDCGCRRAAIYLTILANIKIIQIVRVIVL